MTDFGTTYSAFIASGQSLSGFLDIGARHLFAIQMPDAWDGTVLTFTAEAPGDNEYLPIYDENGAEKTATVAAGRFILLDPLPWLGVRRFQIRSGSFASPVNQTADRKLFLQTVP